MLGKFSVPVLLGVLAVMAAPMGSAAAPPAKDDIIPLVRYAPATNLPSLPLESDTIASIQAGTPLVSPGTLCVGDWMGARYWRIGGTFCGGEVYYSLQDPSLTIPYSWNPVGCSPSYTFNVTAVNMEVNKRPASEGPNPFTFNLQPIVFDADLSAPGCPVPGGVRCAGPVYAIILNGGSTGATFKVNLPFTIECCVSGPYFAAVYLAGAWPCGIAQVTTDDQTLSATPPAPPPQVCHQYVHDPEIGGRYDWIRDNFAYHLRLYSEGYAPNDLATHCTPGICDYQYWYAPNWGRMNADLAQFAFTIPDASGSRQKMGVRFISRGLDTLKSVSFMGWTYAGTPDITVEVWGAGPAQAGTTCWPSEPLTLLYSVTIPNASLHDYPLTNDVPIPDIVWGVLNGGQPHDLFVTIGVAGGLPNRWAVLARTITAGTCGDEPHSVAQVSGNWWYLGDYYGDNDEIYLDANICEEDVIPIPPLCPSPDADDWNTWMHDYQRTGASAMNVDNPCGVRAQWSQFLPRLSNFTNPVIAGGKVYVSTDYEVNSFDLATGTPGNSVGAFPYMGGQVRSNVSVEGNRVVMTGGAALSISCWDTTLTTVFWSNDMTSPRLGLAAHGPLATRNRFGATVVYRVGSDSVVAVGTEMPGTTGNGWLYALDARTGYLYGGWGTNPIMLDRGSFLSPSFDGTNLYVGTARYSSYSDGSLYSINAATGAINWNYKDADAAQEGWPGGVSIEGDMIYGATYDYSTASDYSGHRYAIDKSLAGPGPTLDPAAIKWRRAEGPTLYAAPTIGRNFLYIPQDNPSSGILMVDKLYGTAVHNFATNGVGAVTQPVTLTCDNFLFAGDRLGYWYLLNATDLSAEWRREFTGIVNGTSLAHHRITGDDYAVVSARSSYSGPAGAGVVSAWRFGQPDRPFLHQYVFSTEIQVPLSSGSGLLHTEPGVYGNDGCHDLRITATNLHDVAPNTTAKSYSSLHAEYAATLSRFKVGDDYTAYFEGTPKQLRRAGLVLVDGELNSYDLAIEKASEAFQANRHAAGSAAAAAGILRTSNVTYSSNPIPYGAITNVSWNYDGTGLGRGSDDEIIESVNNDPDSYPEDLTHSSLGYPNLAVHYAGGCPDENTTITWNTLGVPNTEKVWNHGALGDGKAGSLVWGADANFNASLYDGGFLLAGDSSAAVGGAQLAIDAYDMWGFYRPNLRPSDSTCGFDRATDIHLGYRRNGGCPGDPVEILGGWVRSAYADTNVASYFGSDIPIGVNVTQTEVAAQDPMYGDFKLISWNLENRDAVAKDLKAGSYIDWDVAGDPRTNVGLLSDNFNGYAVWDAVTPRYAYGMFDPNLPTSHCGIDPSANSPHKILVSAWYDFWWCSPFDNCNEAGITWHFAVRPPYRDYWGGPQGPAGAKDDLVAFLVNKGFTLPASGTYEVVQALYAVPATSNDVATIDALGVAVAKRAARWAGFARGDVNDDGCVNLADVCWLSSGNQIYPDTYCGDVNLDGNVDTADQAYLLDYVSGVGSAPQGAWRFTF